MSDESINVLRKQINVIWSEIARNKDTLEKEKIKKKK